MSPSDASCAAAGALDGERLCAWLRDMQASDGRPSLRDRIEIAELIESGRFALPADAAFQAGAEAMRLRIADALERNAAYMGKGSAQHAVLERAGWIRDGSLVPKESQ